MTRRQLLRYGGGLLGVWSLAIAGLALTARPELTEVRGFPSFVTANARPAYAAALAAPELMRSLPCYCGCVNLAVPHRDLYDCFVTPTRAVRTACGRLWTLPGRGSSRGLKKSHFGLLRLFRSRRLSGYC